MGAAKKGARKRHTVQIEQSINRNIRDVEAQQVQASQHPCGSASFRPADIVLPKAGGAGQSSKVKSTSCQHLKFNVVAGATRLILSGCRRPCIRPVCCGEAASLFNPSRQHICRSQVPSDSSVMASLGKPRRRSARRTSAP